jgi:hypothetical protein
MNLRKQWTMEEHQCEPKPLVVSCKKSIPSALSLLRKLNVETVTCVNEILARLKTQVTWLVGRLRSRYFSQILVKTELLKNIPSSQPHATARTILCETCSRFIYIYIDVGVL